MASLARRVSRLDRRKISLRSADGRT